MVDAVDAQVDVMAFGAHPDDIELGCGGTLIKLIDMAKSVVLVDMTEAEMSTRGTLETRRVEAAQATKIIGALARENLQLPDGDVPAGGEGKRRVAQIIRRYRPLMILAPYYEDRHPDHYYTSHVVYESAFLSGLARYETGQPNYRPARLVYYMHWNEFEPTFIIDITAQFERKMQAIAAYSTQFAPDDDTWQQTRLTSPEHAWLRRSRMAYYGSLIGKKYGEAFLIRGRMEVDSPLDVNFSSF